MRLFLQAGAIHEVDSITCYGEEREASTYRVEDSIKGILLAYRTPWPFTGQTAGGVSEAPTFREDTGDIVATFSAGWVTPGQVALDGELVRDLPQVFEEACITTVTAWYREKGKNPNVASQSTGNASISFASGGTGRDALPLAARTMVGRYRKHVR